MARLWVQRPGACAAFCAPAGPSTASWSRLAWWKSEGHQATAVTSPWWPASTYGLAPSGASTCVFSQARRRAQICSCGSSGHELAASSTPVTVASGRGPLVLQILPWAPRSSNWRSCCCLWPGAAPLPCTWDPCTPLTISPCPPPKCTRCGRWSPRGCACRRGSTPP